MAEIYVTCPHCAGEVEIPPNQLNCRIFRHGMLKSNGEQVNPHLPKDQCDHLTTNNLVEGCCKPFMVVQQDDKWTAVVCDYI